MCRLPIVAVGAPQLLIVPIAVDCRDVTVTAVVTGFTLISGVAGLAPRRLRISSMASGVCGGFFFLGILPLN